MPGCGRGWRLASVRPRLTLSPLTANRFTTANETIFMRISRSIPGVGVILVATSLGESPMHAMLRLPLVGGAVVALIGCSRESGNAPPAADAGGNNAGQDW